MKSRKIQDLNRYLIHTRFLGFFVIRIGSQLFAIDPNEITASNLINALLGNKPLYLLSSIEEFVKSFQISRNHLFEIDKEMMNRVGYAIKKLEYWHYRQVVDDVFPGKSNIINQENITFWNRQYDVWKLWVAKSRKDDSKFLDYLVLEEDWNVALSSLNPSYFPEEYYPFIKALLWFKGNQNFQESLENIIPTYQLFFLKGKTKDRIGGQIEALKYVLGFQNKIPEDYEENTLTYLRDKIIGQPHIQNISLIKRNLIKNILVEIPEGFTDWKKLIYRDFTTFKEIEWRLNDQRIIVKKKGIGDFIKKIIAFQAKKEAFSFPTLIIPRIVEVIKFSHIREMVQIQQTEQFLIYIKEYSRKDLEEIKIEVELINQGFSAKNLITLAQVKESVYQLKKHSHLIPVLANYIELIKSLPLSQIEIDLMLKEVDLDDFVNLDSKSTQRIDEFIEAIRGIIGRLSAEKEPYLKTFLNEIPQLIFSISKSQTKTLTQWLKPTKKLRFVKDLVVPDYLESFRKDLEQLGHHQQLLGEEGLPKSILNLFSQKEKLEKQITFIQQKIEDGNGKLINRLETLETQLDQFEFIHFKQVQKKIQNSLQKARIHSLKKIILNITEEQLKQFISNPKIIIEENSIKSIFLFIRFLTFTGERERLKKLVSIYLDKSNDYKLAFKSNQEWLNKAKKKGVNIDAWQKPFRETYDFGKGTLTFYESTNPIEIFMMGYYFDTCLSIKSGMNKDAVIKNATDINKKVIFIKNQKGQIVGRKLIGLSSRFKLIGFYTYYAGDFDKKKDVTIKEFNLLADQYCFNLAKESNVKLSNNGTLSELNEGFWYFDGLVNFDNKYFLDQGVEMASVKEDFVSKEFPYHPYFLQYYFRHQTDILEICQSLDVEPPNLTDRNEEENVFLYVVELGIRVAAKQQDRDFLSFTIEHVPSELKLDAVFEWAMLMGDKAIPYLKDYCKHKEEQLSILWKMKTPAAMKLFLEMIFKADHGIFCISNGFFQICGLEMQKKIFPYFYKYKSIEDYSYQFFYGFYELHEEILAKYLFKIINKYIDVNRNNDDYFGYNLNSIRNLFENVLLRDSSKLTGVLREFEHIFEIHKLKGLDEKEGIEINFNSFLMLHPSRLSTAYFKKKVADYSEFKIDEAVFYLCFNQLNSRHITDNLFQKLPDKWAWVSLLLTKNKKLIQKAEKKLKTDKIWESIHTEAQKVVNYMMEDDLIGVKNNFYLDFPKEIYNIYLLDYYRRKGFDQNLVDLLVDWGLDKEKRYYFARLMYTRFFSQIENRKLQLQLIKLQSSHQKPDNLFDFLVGANIDEVRWLKENVTPGSIHLNPNWHLFKQKKINPKFIEILRPLFFNAYYDFYSEGDFESEKEYLIHYPLRADSKESLTPLRHKISKFTFEAERS